MKNFGQYEMVERPSVTETDRGGVYEMDRQTNRQKKGKCHWYWSNYIRFFFTGTRVCYYIWSISVAYPCF